MHIKLLKIIVCISFKTQYWNTNNNGKTFLTIGKECTNDNDTWDIIKNCIQTNGNYLQHLMGIKTKKEGVNYVPWIVINGIHNRYEQFKAQNELCKYICKLRGLNFDICL